MIVSSAVPATAIHHLALEVLRRDVDPPCTRHQDRHCGVTRTRALELSTSRGGAWTGASDSSHAEIVRLAASVGVVMRGPSRPT